MPSNQENMQKFKKEICPNCIHYKEEHYTGCGIVIAIDGEANCTEYKCVDYQKRKKKDV